MYRLAFVRLVRTSQKVYILVHWFSVVRLTCNVISSLSGEGQGHEVWLFMGHGFLF